MLGPHTPHKAGGLMHTCCMASQVDRCYNLPARGTETMQVLVKIREGTQVIVRGQTGDSNYLSCLWWTTGADAERTAPRLQATQARVAEHQSGMPATTRWRCTTRHPWP